jgi:hypothetical protein
VQKERGVCKNCLPLSCGFCAVTTFWWYANARLEAPLPPPPIRCVADTGLFSAAELAPAKVGTGKCCIAGESVRRMRLAVIAENAAGATGTDASDCDLPTFYSPCTLVVAIANGTNGSAVLLSRRIRRLVTVLSRLFRFVLGFEVGSRCFGFGVVIHRRRKLLQQRRCTWRDVRRCKRLLQLSQTEFGGR